MDASAQTHPITVKEEPKIKVHITFFRVGNKKTSLGCMGVLGDTEELRIQLLDNLLSDALMSSVGRGGA